MKCDFYLDITPFQLVNNYGHFEGAYLPSSSGLSSPNISFDTSIYIYQWIRRHIPQDLKIFTRIAVIKPPTCSLLGS